MAVDWLSDVKKYVANVDEMAVAGIVRYCGIALRNRDSSLVAFSDSAETDRVRTNFLKKKLALTDSDDVLNAAIAAVGAKMKGDRTKNRVTVYYLLAQNFGELAMFAAAPKGKAAAKPKAGDDVAKAAAKPKAGAGAAKAAGAAGAATGAAAASAAKPKTTKAAKSAAATPAPAKPAPAKKAAAAGAAATSGAKAAKLVSTTKTSAAKPAASPAPAPAGDGVESGGTLGGAAAAIGGAAAAGAAAVGAAAAGLVGGGASGSASATGSGTSTGGGSASGGSAAESADSGGRATASGGGGGQKFADVPDEGGGSGFRWWWLLLLLFALLLAFVLLKSCMHQSTAPLANSTEVTDGNTTDDATLGGNDMIGDNAMAPAASAPAGAGIVASAPAGLPMLTIYFATGKADVASDFAAQAAELKAYLAAHPDAKLRVSGYNDPSGNAAVNAALSKKRAQAVAAALGAAGIAEGSVMLEKPADTTIAGADASAARRVEVTVKQ